ncbi:unnamed protein product [Rotaria sp. Silwood2]|nr:unnamed protein product [Rotaria sp. Silwood2]
MANQITSAQTIELSQAAGQKLLAQCELDKLNAEGQRRNNANQTTAIGRYNINGQPSKTIELYENELLNKKTIELDAIAATCLLSACTDCHRLDIGEYVHDEILRLGLLDPPNIRLATAVRS